MATKITVKTAESDQEELQKEIPETEVSPDSANIQTEEELKEPLQVSLNIRKGLDKRIVIHDHDHIDIVFMPDTKKVICFSKQDYSDLVYETQTRLFNFLNKKGLIQPESIRASNVYGAFEAKMQENKENIPLQQILVLNISKWLDAERPALDMDREYSQRMTNPSMQDSTELGEVPQEPNKGTIPAHSKRYVGGWW